jgi:hypothetical protein
MPSNGSESSLADFIHSFRGERAEAMDRAAGEKLQLQAACDPRRCGLPRSRSRTASCYYGGFTMICITIITVCATR